MVVQLLLLQSLLTNSYLLDAYTHASEFIVNNSVKNLFMDEMPLTPGGMKGENRADCTLLILMSKPENGNWQSSKFSLIKKSENILDAVDVIIKDECPSLRVGLKLHFY